MAIMTGFTANFNTEYKDLQGVVVATSYARVSIKGITISLSIKDYKAYEADKDNIEKKESDFRYKITKIYDMMYS